MTLPPEQWGRMLGGYTDEAFKRKLYKCDDVERLRAAIEHEIERHGDTRQERIAKLNQRIASVRE